MIDKKNILIIYKAMNKNAQTIVDHYNSFGKFGNNRYFLKTPEKLISLSAAIDDFLDLFDGIILHYTLYFPNLGEAYPSLVSAISTRNIPKVVFIQDEYRSVNKTCDVILALKVTDVFSVCLPTERDIIYKRLLDNGLKLHTTLTGYAPQGREEFIPLRDRLWDISYRARGLRESFPWLGLKAFEKSEIAEGVQLRAKNLRANISTLESDRIYGRKWRKLLSNSRSTLITISGASIVDFEGSIEAEIRCCYSYDQKSAADVTALVKKYEGNINATMISPRIFEAANCYTAMIGFDDHYNGILVGGRHYIVLERDFSNFDKIMEVLNDDEKLLYFINNAHDTLIKSGKYTWDSFVKEFEASTFLDIIPKSLFIRRYLSFLISLFFMYVSRKNTIDFKNIFRIILLSPALHQIRLMLKSLLPDRVKKWLRRSLL